MTVSSGPDGAQARAPSGEEGIDLTRLNLILEEFKGKKGAVIPILQRTQDEFGYLPKPALHAIANATNIPLQQLYGAATFYTQFHLARRGKHLVRVCDGTACHVRGADKNISAVSKALTLAPGETSPDYRYTLEIVYCLGSCGLFPVALVDDKVYGRLAPQALVDRLQALD